MENCEHLDTAETLDSYKCLDCGFELEVGDTQFYTG